MMKKRNTRPGEGNSRFATSSMGVASLIVSGFIMMMIFFAMNSRCAAISREIGLKERELDRLEQELSRERTRWDELKTPRRMNVALARFGLEMDVPKEDQIVRMSATGAPVPGQLAMARLRNAAQPPAAKLAQASVTRRTPSRTAPRRAAKNGVRK